MGMRFQFLDSFHHHNLLDLLVYSAAGRPDLQQTDLMPH